jgi:hypothetical protein
VFAHARANRLFTEKYKYSAEKQLTKKGTREKAASNMQQATGRQATKKAASNRKLATGRHANKGTMKNTEGTRKTSAREVCA